MTLARTGFSSDMLDGLPRFPAGTSFGADIDAANQVLLSGAAEEAKRSVLLDWVARHQPCVFGRVATKAGAAAKGLGMTLCWIDESTMDSGPDAMAARIAVARRDWKEQAANGESSAFLIMFNSTRLAHAMPSPELVRVAVDLASLYLVERAPVQPEVIYTEAIPLRGPDETLRLFKGSVQLFHTGAHLRRHHDRRVPGGLLISVNGPGHYANALVARGVFDSLQDSAAFVRRMAARSIGVGGLGSDDALSTTWHRGTCPADRDTARWFSAAYHLDVFVQAEVVGDPRMRTGPCPPDQAWSWLHLDYIDARKTTPADKTHGWFHGTAIANDAMHHNPWLPVIPVDTPDFNY